MLQQTNSEGAVQTFLSDALHRRAWSLAPSTDQLQWIFVQDKLVILQSEGTRGCRAVLYRNQAECQEGMRPLHLATGSINPRKLRGI